MSNEEYIEELKRVANENLESFRNLATEIHCDRSMMALQMSGLALKMDSLYEGEEARHHLEGVIVDEVKELQEQCTVLKQELDRVRQALCGVPTSVSVDIQGQRIVLLEKEVFGETLSEFESQNGTVDDVETVRKYSPIERNYLRTRILLDGALEPHTPPEVAEDLKEEEV